MNTIMIWGGAGGIGSAIVRKFVEHNWTVVAMARALPQETLGATWIETDLAYPHSIQNAVRQASMEVEPVNAWVYAAGDITSAKTAEGTPEAWQRILHVNLAAAHLATYYSLPLMAESAHLFYIGAVSERMRLPGLGAYAAAKAGLEAFVDTLAKEERKKKVTLIRPGAVNTPFWQKVPFKMPASALAPEMVAQRILAAYTAGEKGTLDI